MSDRLPDITPSPYTGSDYMPGWAAKDIKPTHVFPRTDLVWLDRQWALTTEGHKPARSWWREHGWNGDGLVPLLGSALASALLVIVAMLIFG